MKTSSSAAGGGETYSQVCDCSQPCEDFGKILSSSACVDSGGANPTYSCGYTYSNTTCSLGVGDVCTRHFTVNSNGDPVGDPGDLGVVCPANVFDISPAGGTNITAYMGESVALGYQISAGSLKNSVNVSTEVAGCPAGATCSPSGATNTTVFTSDDPTYGAKIVTPLTSAIQTYSVGVTAYDTDRPDCAQTVYYSVTVKPSRKMVCDSQWRDIPFGPSAYYVPGPAVGIYRDNGANNSYKQIVAMHRGGWLADASGNWRNGVLRTACNYLGNDTSTTCVWDTAQALPFNSNSYGWQPYADYTSLIAGAGSAVAEPYLALSANTLLTRLRFTNSSQTYRHSEGSGNFTFEGNTAYPWGQPTAMVDPAGRTITLNNGGNYLQYKCDPPAQATYGYTVTGTLNFTAQQNSVAPPAQNIQVVNTGNQSLTLSISENISWASINRTSLTLSPGQTGTVGVSITATNLTPGARTGNVTFSHAQAGNRNTSVAYELTGMAPVCDNNWHEAPGGGVTPSQPVGIAVPRNPAPGDTHPTFDSQYYDSILMSVRAIGATSAPHVQACRFNGGNECTFDGAWLNLGASTPYPPHLRLGWSVNMNIKDAWGSMYERVNYLTGWQTNPDWTGPAADPGWMSWGQPFRTTDKTGRTWQFSKNSYGRVMYACGSPVCVPLGFNGANSSMSATSVAIGQSFSVRCDYGVKGIDSITVNAPTGISCAYQAASSFGNANPTQAVFTCAAQTGAQSGTVSCGLRNNTSSFTCSQTNAVGNISINRATIGASPNSFAFTKVSGAPAPAAQTLTLSNTGAGTLNFTARTNDNWCRINGRNNTGTVSGSLAAGVSQNISVSVDDTNTQGTRGCMITVTAPDSSNSPQDLPIVYTVSAAPIYSYSVTASLNFTATRNGALPASQNISVTNTGNQALTIGVSESISWANISTSSLNLNPGQSGQVSVSVNTTALSAGNYSGSVQFSHAQAGNRSTVVNYQVNSPTPPQTPNLSFASTSCSGNTPRITLNYSGNQPPPVDSLEIYRNGAATPVFTDNSVASNNEQWTDSTGLVSGTAYTYTARAFSSGQPSGYTPGVPVTAPNCMPNANIIPTISTVNGSGTFDVSRIKDGDTVVFRVTYQNVGGGTATLLTSINDFSPNLVFTGTFWCQFAACSVTSQSAGNLTFTTANLAAGSQFNAFMEARVQNTSPQAREIASLRVHGNVQPGGAPFDATYSLLASPQQTTTPRFREVPP